MSYGKVGNIQVSLFPCNLGIFIMAMGDPTIIFTVTHFTY